MSKPVNDKDEEFLKAVKTSKAKERKAQMDEAVSKMSSQYKRHWTTEELNLLKQKAKDEVLGYVMERLPLWLAVPQLGQQIIDGFTARDPSLTDFPKIIKYIENWIEYNHAIKTAEEYEIQYDRAEKILYYEGIQVPIVLMLDYQVHGFWNVIERPTFYSYWDGNYAHILRKGAFFISFPATIAYLSEDELMVVLKHEFGHIIQGHCEIHSSDPFDANYQNAAMDISINCGMTHKEQELLLSAAEKLFGQKAYPCLSLIGPKEQGGFNIKKPVQPGAWVDALNSIRLYYKKDQNPEQQGQKQGQKGEQGSGEGSGGSGEGKLDDTIRIGDPVLSRDGNNPVYGRVMSIDPVTGDIAEIQEMTKEEFDDWGKKVADGTFGT